MYRFVELLGEQRAATRENVQRKQAQTGEEREESDEEQISDDESDDDDEDIPYNPKNLPLGWDGKVREILFHKFVCLDLKIKNFNCLIFSPKRSMTWS